MSHLRTLFENLASLLDGLLDNPATINGRDDEGPYREIGLTPGIRRMEVRYRIRRYESSATIVAKVTETTSAGAMVHLLRAGGTVEHFSMVSEQAPGKTRASDADEIRYLHDNLTAEPLVTDPLWSATARVA